MVLADVEGVLADLRHRHAVGEQPDLAQHHPLAGGHGRLQAVRLVRLDADHLDLRTQVLDVGGDAGDQSATAHRDEDRIEAAGLLAENLHGHGALAGDGVRIVVGMDEGVALLVDQLQRVGQRLGEGVAVQHRLGAMGAHRLDLDLGVVLGITMTALIPCRLAARARPWAWLPAEAAITPRAFSSSVSCATLL